MLIFIEYDLLKGIRYEVWLASGVDIEEITKLIVELSRHLAIPQTNFLFSPHIHEVTVDQ